MATLCVIRCAVSMPMPGSPRASATAATTGTARSAETVSTPSSLSFAVALITASASAKSTTFAMSASCRPGRVRVAVDRRDPQAHRLRLHDRTALMTARADEEDGSHGPMLLRRWSFGALVARCERRPDELERSLDVDREAGPDGGPRARRGRRRGTCRPTRARDVASRHEPVRAALLEMPGRSARAGRGCAASHCSRRRSLGAQHAARPRGTRRPVRVLVADAPHDRLEPLLQPERRRSRADPRSRARRRAPTCSGSS